MRWVAGSAPGGPWQQAPRASNPARSRLRMPFNLAWSPACLHGRRRSSRPPTQRRPTCGTRASRAGRCCSWGPRGWSRSWRQRASPSLAARPGACRCRTQRMRCWACRWAAGAAGRLQTRGALWRRAGPSALLLPLQGVRAAAAGPLASNTPSVPCPTAGGARHRRGGGGLGPAF